MILGAIWIIQTLINISFSLIAGIIRIVFDTQRLIKFFILIIIVVADSMFIMQDCKTFQESIVHIFIICLPVVYIFKN